MRCDLKRRGHLKAAAAILLALPFMATLSVYGDVDQPVVDQPVVGQPVVGQPGLVTATDPVHPVPLRSTETTRFVVDVPVGAKIYLPAGTLLWPENPVVVSETVVTQQQPHAGEVRWLQIQPASPAKAIGNPIETTPETWNETDVKSRSASQVEGEAVGKVEAKAAESKPAVASENNSGQDKQPAKEQPAKEQSAKEQPAKKQPAKKQPSRNRPPRKRSRKRPHKRPERPAFDSDVMPDATDARSAGSEEVSLWLDETRPASADVPGMPLELPTARESRSETDAPSVHFDPVFPVAALQLLNESAAATDSLGRPGVSGPESGPVSDLIFSKVRDGRFDMHETSETDRLTRWTAMEVAALDGELGFESQVTRASASYPALPDSAQRLIAPDLLWSNTPNTLKAPYRSELRWLPLALVLAATGVLVAAGLRREHSPRFVEDATGKSEQNGLKPTKTSSALPTTVTVGAKHETVETVISGVGVTAQPDAPTRCAGTAASCQRTAVPSACDDAATGSLRTSATMLDDLDRLNLTLDRLQGDDTTGNVWETLPAKLDRIDGYESGLSASDGKGQPLSRRDGESGRQSVDAAPHSVDA